MLLIYPLSPWEDYLSFFSACYHFHRLFPARTGNCFQCRHCDGCLKRVFYRETEDTLKVQNKIDRAVVDSHKTMLDGKKKLDDQIEMLTFAGMSVLQISRILRHTRWGHCVLVRQHCCD